MIIETDNREHILYMESVRENTYSRILELAQARIGRIDEPIVLPSIERPIHGKADVVTHLDTRPEILESGEVRIATIQEEVTSVVEEVPSVVEEVPSVVED